ncbi:nucleotidyltransferase domain-containing protein [Psychroserpens luteolus]|uniref:nucleotidyltransferase domain-containing protein n=1 Tax=Psychroserpens luteolus TaxID=2855840 RepID=UPI001E46D351|nr:nucleotidyltransferase domain-containing protein [Psychroserpens luteolus]MCD2257650.1 nucleotidyltransferase domain-containing protein [Psychroserpens luteolus]
MTLKHQYNITINKYDGTLDLVRDIALLIDRKYAKIFHSVVVHGSVATNEVIPYSDFDGLLIVRDEFVNSKQLQKFKIESMKLILKFDPLQHHGWFQIKESDLKSYPENYLPVSTLEHSKLIYPSKENLEYNLKFSEEIDYKSSLRAMLNQFEKRHQNNWKPSNTYELKSILSQIMLMPCLYYSAINNKGIFKRESFDAVKHHFTDQEWEPIVIASQLRKDWNNNFSKLQLVLLKIPHPLLRKIIKKFGAPKINLATQNMLNREFYSNLNMLIKKINTDIQ